MVRPGAGVLFALFVLTLASVGHARCGGGRYAIDDLVRDMEAPHEARPDGVARDWGLAPRPAPEPRPPAGWRAIIPWGHVYAVEGSVPPRPVRVHICNLRMAVLNTASGRWEIVTRTDRIEGGAFDANYDTNAAISADLRAEPGGGVSVTLSPGRNVHFWPAEGRVSLDPVTFGGAVVLYDARLIAGGRARPDDLAHALIVAGAGGDFWRSLSAPWDEFRTNRDFGIGRFKRVTPVWRTFGAHSLSTGALRADPPPLLGPPR